MALFTDSDIATLARMLQIDSEVETAAKSARPAIQLEGAGSVCEQAWQECAQRLTAAMQMYTSYLMQPGMSGGHVAAVLNIGTPARTQPRMRLQQIVATDSQYGNARSTTETWLTYTALALLFRDVSSRLDKDRYQEKFERYDAQAKYWWMQLRNNGLPFLWQPLEAPGAKHSFKPGTWGSANVTPVTGSGVTAAQYQVAISYCDTGRGYVSQAANGNAESAPSDLISITVAAAQVIHVDISTLNPPNGQPDQTGLSQGAWTPLNATHWNLWAAAGNDGVLYLQRELIPIATKTFSLAADPVLSGATAGNGQYADLNMVFQNLAMRG